MSGVEKVNVWDYQWAIQYFDQAIQSQPNDTEAYILRGEMKSRLWDDQGALQDYNDAIIINPSEPMAYMFRAMEKRNTLSDLTGAIMDFDKSIEYKSNNSEAYGSRGIAKIELNKIQEWCDDLQKALTLDFVGTKGETEKVAFEKAMEVYCK